MIGDLKPEMVSSERPAETGMTVSGSHKAAALLKKAEARKNNFIFVVTILLGTFPLMKICLYKNCEETTKTKWLHRKKCGNGSMMRKILFEISGRSKFSLVSRHISNAWKCDGKTSKLSDKIAVNDDAPLFGFMGADGQSMRNACLGCAKFWSKFRSFREQFKGKPCNMSAENPFVQLKDTSVQSTGLFRIWCVAHKSPKKSKSLLLRISKSEWFASFFFKDWRIFYAWLRSFEFLYYTQQG